MKADSSNTTASGDSPRYRYRVLPAMTTNSKIRDFLRILLTGERVYLHVEFESLGKFELPSGDAELYFQDPQGYQAVKTNIDAGRLGPTEHVVHHPGVTRVFLRHSNWPGDPNAFEDYAGGRLPYDAKMNWVPITHFRATSLERLLGVATVVIGLVTLLVILLR